MMILVGSHLNGNELFGVLVHSFIVLMYSSISGTCSLLEVVSRDMPMMDESFQDTQTVHLLVWSEL